MGTARKGRGRPAGLLLNPAALEHLLGGRTQAWLAGAARVSAGGLFDYITGARGATRPIAERIAAALDCKPEVLFPELVGFNTTVRVFTARGAEE